MKVTHCNFTSFCVLKYDVCPWQLPFQFHRVFSSQTSCTMIILFKTFQTILIFLNHNIFLCTMTIVFKTFQTIPITKHSRQAPITILKCSGSFAIQPGWQVPWERDYASSLPGLSPRSGAILDTEKWMKGLGCQEIRSLWDCKPKVLPLGICAMLLPCSGKQKVGWTPGLCLGTTTNKVEAEIPSQNYKPHKLC